MSELSTGFKLMNKALRTGSIKGILRYCVQPCKRCGRRPLDIYLDELLGMKTEKCVVCRAALSILKLASGLAVQPKQWRGPENSSLSAVVSKSYWRKGIASLLKGLIYFGPNRPFSTGAPLLVVWNFTNQCNLRCKHCYQDASVSPLNNELTTEEALKLVEEFAEADVTSISFSGGEPLCRRDLYEVAGRAKELGMYVSVATNGTLITREVAQKLAKVIHYAEISLDGASPEVHEGFRMIPGTWEKTVQGIKNCVDAGIYTAIATTATKMNLKEIPQLVEFAKDVKAKTFLCFNFVPTGRATDVTNLDLDPLEREHLLEFLYEKLVEFMVKGGPNVFVTAPQFGRVGLQRSKNIQDKFSKYMRGVFSIVPATHYGNLPNLTADLADFIGGCGAGRVYCGLTPDGILTPCVFMPIPLGDLRKDRFEDVWIYSPVLNDLRNREKLVGRCGECSYKYICGGCRARAYGYYGNYLYPDPGCVRSLEGTLGERVPTGELETSPLIQRLIASRSLPSCASGKAERKKG